MNKAQGCFSCVSCAQGEQAGLVFVVGHRDVGLKSSKAQILFSHHPCCAGGAARPPPVLSSVRIKLNKFIFLAQHGAGFRLLSAPHAQGFLCLSMSLSRPS